MEKALLPCGRHIVDDHRGAGIRDTLKKEWARKKRETPADTTSPRPIRKVNDHTVGATMRGEGSKKITHCFPLWKRDLSCASSLLQHMLDKPPHYVPVAVMVVKESIAGAVHREECGTSPPFHISHDR